MIIMMKERTSDKEAPLWRRQNHTCKRELSFLALSMRAHAVRELTLEEESSRDRFAKSVGRNSTGHVCLR